MSIFDNAIECWGCGMIYDGNENEICPKCREHPEDEPKTPEEEFQEDWKLGINQQLREDLNNIDYDVD